MLHLHLLSPTLAATFTTTADLSRNSEPAVSLYLRACYCKAGREITGTVIVHWMYSQGESEDEALCYHLQCDG